MKQMMILPQPQQLVAAEGVFSLCGCNVSVTAGMDYRVVAAANRFLVELSAVTGTSSCLYVAPQAFSNQIQILLDGGAAEGYRLTIASDGIRLAGTDAAGAFYGLQTLTQLLRNNGAELPCMEITDYPDMKYRGFYHDVTRGRVPTVEGVKKIVDQLALYKINSLQLYVEHTFDFREFRDENRTAADCLTAQDILDIDTYCYDHFIDFVPSLSTFGHLHDLLTRAEFRHLCELENYESNMPKWYDRMAHHTVDPSNPDSKKLVFSLIDQYLPLFRSQYFNICCDETFDLCKGRNAGKDVGQVYCNFVKTISQHVKELGKTVMMWGDIVLEHPEYISSLPKDTIVLNWDYSPTPNPEKVRAITRHNIPQIVCPGTTSWNHLTEQIGVARDNIRLQAQWGYENNAIGLLNTNWGDFGHVASFQCALYGMIMGAAISWNRQTQMDEAFEQAASHNLWRTDINVVKQLERLNQAEETGNWYQFVMWNTELARKDISRDSAVYEKSMVLCDEIYEVFQKLPDSLNKTHLLVATEGIRLLNEAMLKIAQNGDFRKWYDNFECWVARYEELWRIDCKESELSNIHSFVKNIPQMCRFD